MGDTQKVYDGGGTPGRVPPMLGTPAHFLNAASYRTRLFTMREREREREREDIYFTSSDIMRNNSPDTLLKACWHILEDKILGIILVQ